MAAETDAPWVEAAARVLIEHWHYPANTCPDCTHNAQRVLTAAEPLIRADEREKALTAILALHVPWWTDNKGKRHDHYVSVHTDDLPEGHVCTLERDPDDPWPDTCDPDVDEHVVLACCECRCPTEDGEVAYLVWPCTTRKLCDEAEATP